MLELIFAIGLWAVFITIYVKHKRKVKEFTKVNPNFFSSTDDEVFTPKNDTVSEEFIKDQHDRISSPVYSYLACNINHDSNKY